MREGSCGWGGRCRDRARPRRAYPAACPLSVGRSTVRLLQLSAPLARLRAGKAWGQASDSRIRAKGLARPLPGPWAASSAQTLGAPTAWIPGMSQNAGTARRGARRASRQALTLFTTAKQDRQRDPRAGVQITLRTGVAVSRLSPAGVQLVGPPMGPGSRRAGRVRACRTDDVSTECRDKATGASRRPGDYRSIPSRTPALVANTGRDFVGTSGILFDSGAFSLTAHVVSDREEAPCVRS